MDWDSLALIGGLALTAATLFDVFATVVVPGRVWGPIDAPRRLRTLMFHFWRTTLAVFARKPGARIGGVFGAMQLMLLLLIWIALTLLGLSLAAWSLRQSFAPPLDAFGDAAFQIGSAMMTLGLSGQTAEGWARALVVLAGLCGFQIVTLTLSFIVQIQTALRDRDALVLKLASRAGAPPSGVALLETVRRLEVHGGMPHLFERWEDWSAAVLNTHAAHPVLAYFRSDEGGIDWLTALGAVLDAAAINVAMLGEAPAGDARLMLDSGARTVRRLCHAFGLHPRQAQALSNGEIARAAGRLAVAGYAVLPGREERLREEQRGYRGELAALIHHFGVDAPAWVGEQEECAASA